NDTATTAATACSASGPVAAAVTCWPLVAPRPITASTLLALTVLSPTVKDTSAANLAAATANAPAGRACRSPSSVMTCSQLSGMPSLLRRAAGHGLDIRAGRRGHGGRHHALDERRVGQFPRPGQVVGVGQQRPDGQ